MKLLDYSPNISMESIYTNRGNSKKNESHKFFLNLLQRLGLMSSKKHVAI